MPSASTSVAAGRSRSATASTPSSRTANSSPASRATVSVVRIVLTSRSATACSSRSPASWPSVSLTFLKSSRSRNITATSRRSRRASAMRVLDAIAEQVPIGQPGQRIVKRLLPQLLFEPLRSLMSRRLSASPCTAGSSVRLLPTISSVSGCRAALDRRSSTGPTAPVGVAATSARKPCSARRRRRPQVEEVAADDVVGLQAERPLERRRGEPQGAVWRDDQDDVRRIRDERGVSRLDHFLRPPLAGSCVVAQHGALAEHDEQREHEDDDRHYRHRAADLARAT